MAQIAIQLNGLSKAFGDVRALDDVSLSVPEGSVFGLLGANGAGKTTLIRLLLGLLEASGGGGTVLGHDIAAQAAEIRQHTGVLLDNPGLYNHLTVFDNLEFYGRVWHLPAGERHDRIHELARHYDFEDKLQAVTETLSKGTRQKVAIARAILHKPRLLILDEPTTGLDPVSIVTLRNDIWKMASEDGTTIFLNTHALHEAELICDMVGIVRRGKLIAVEKTDVMIAKSEGNRILLVLSAVSAALRDALGRYEGLAISEEGDRAVVSVRGDGQINDVLATIASCGGVISTIKQEGGRLEAAYLQYMEER